MDERLIAPRPRSTARKALGGVALLAVLVGVPAYALGRGGYAAERLAVTRAAGCGAHVGDPVPTPATLGWPHLERAARIECRSGDVPPAVTYVRFPDVASMRRDVLAHPSSQPLCVDGRSIYEDLLDAGQFAKLCRTVDGRLVDAVSRLPDLPSDGTAGSMDAEAAAQDARNARVQGRALRALWR